MSEEETARSAISAERAMKLALEAFQKIVEQHGNWNNGIWASNIAAGCIRPIREALAEQPAQQQEPVNNWWHPSKEQFSAWCERHNMQPSDRDAFNDAATLYQLSFAALTKQTEHEFKNFHRLLCERFGYTHDERDWKRDQVSLIEWIAKQTAQQQEPVKHELQCICGCSWEIDADGNEELVSSPPAQQEPLTDDEIAKEVEAELTHYWNGEYIDTTGARDQLTAFARAIEAKLKEKNA